MGMLQRLGDVIYLFTSVLAGLLVFANVISMMSTPTPGAPAPTLLGFILGGLLWILGKACRYILRGN